MATKEDILEQITEEYFIEKGYFVQHNIKYKPSKEHAEHNSKKDSVHSDIDILGINPTLFTPERVVVVSCKSSQNGFNPKNIIDAIENEKKISGREAWKGFRELVEDKWSEALKKEVYIRTGEKKFLHIVAVTKLIGSKECWVENEKFAKVLGCPLQILEAETMISTIGSNLTKTVANSEVGRLLQIFKASGILK
jgi:hypothetical protein